MSDGDERRTRRRAVIKELHPDRGGDVSTFIAALAELDAAGPPADRASGASLSAPVLVTTRPRSLRTLRRRSRSALAGIRRTIPRPWPGSRRYGHL
ncbi:hypothetical protein [Nocardioides nanhaiensis]|uniref:Uncharacterized protein n=1 Tax=Nocardioides nanhaiensis TaxID=1476871 RepID=A0ABP8VUF4_9ACTN